MNRLEKYNTLKSAWGAWGEEPGVNELCLAGAVAEHETRCGDAWPGEHNWGGLQLDKLSEAEHALLDAQNIVPGAPYTTAGETALAAARLILHRADGALHADSSPTKGWYFVWFYAFATDKQGAEVFVSRILGYAGVPAALKTGEPHVVAEAMYRARYFEGFNKPDPAPEETFAGKWPREGWLRTGPLTLGEAKNVDDYITALAKLVPLWLDIVAPKSVTVSQPLPTDLAPVTPTQPRSEDISVRLAPEIPDLRQGEPVRQRVARIAMAHAPLTQAHDLWKLGHFLSSGQETDEKRLAYMATSCGTFARAVLLWAGCEDPLLHEPYAVGSAITRLCQLAGLWTHRRAWCACAGIDGPHPQLGDIYRVQTPGQNDDHVGVICEVLGPWQFRTAEGGQGASGCDVGVYIRQFVERGKFMYCGSRPLQGWIVCDRVGLPDSPPAIGEQAPVAAEQAPVAAAEQAPVAAAEQAPVAAVEQAPAAQSTGVVVAGGAVAAVAVAPWLPWWAVVAVIVAVMAALVTFAWRRSVHASHPDGP